MPTVTIELLDIGAFAEDPASDTARDGGQKIINNFDALKAAVDPIEAGATADQTGAEIKALYEAETDTNPFDDAAVTKLAGIAAGAQVNVALASQAEAEAGIENTKTMTALRVAQALGTVPGSMPLVAGPGQGTGNAITKTLAPTGGDFATFAEVMDYISGNTFDNVELTISVQPGTYAIGSGGVGGQYNLGYGNGIAVLRFIGTNKTTCIFNFDGASPGYEPMLEISGMRCAFSALTINDITGSGSTFINAYVSYITISNCDFVNWYSICWCAETYLGVSDVTSSVPTYGAGTYCFQILNNSFASLYNAVLTDVSGIGFGIYVSSYGIVELVGGISIDNFDTAISADYGGRISLLAAPTLTNNTTNYNIPLNAIQGDGSYITNGGLTFATAAQGTLADNAVPKSLFDANTIIAATADNVPAAVTVAAQTLIGRITAGNIAALTAAQVRTLLNVEDGSTNDQTAAEILAALLTVDGAASGLDADLLDGLSSAAFATAAQGTAADAAKVKTDFLTVTQAVDLDAIETRVNNLDAAVVLVGAWDASAGTFPGGGTAQAGFSYIVSVGGTVDSIVFSVGDRIVAILDNASTTVYAANWLKLDYTDAVLSVNGATGAVSITTITGNAGTATALQNARTIDGTSFDGTANILVVAPATTAAASKATPIDADYVPLVDTAASSILKKLTWVNIKATLKTYFDTLYPSGSGTSSGTNTGDNAANSSSQPVDADLTTIASLVATTNNFIVAVASAWASRTPTQVKATLAIANTDVSGLGTLSTQSGTFSGVSSGTNTGDNATNSSALPASLTRAQLDTAVSDASLMYVGSSHYIEDVQGSDLTADGTTCSMVAAENLVFGDVCYMNSAGKWAKGDADQAATAPALAMAMATIAVDVEGDFLLMGIARNDAWAWTVGGMLFLSVTAGGITQTAPTGTGDVVQLLGVATHADRILFRPSNDWLVLV